VQPRAQGEWRPTAGRAQDGLRGGLDGDGDAQERRRVPRAPAQMRRLVAVAVASLEGRLAAADGEDERDLQELEAHADAVAGEGGGAEAADEASDATA
jgi:hypothetical protein